MPNQVTITTINGTSPYDVYICDPAYTSCFYVSTITLGMIPYTFNVPFLYSSFATVGVKIVDTKGCIINYLVTF